MSVTLKAAVAFKAFGTDYVAGATVDTTGMNDRAVAQLLRHYPVYVSESGASSAGAEPVYTYALTDFPTPSSYHIGAGWVAVNDGPLVTPSQDDWDDWAGDGGTTGAVPMLDEGSYLVSVRINGGDAAVSMWTSAGHYTQTVRRADGSAHPAWVEVTADGAFLFVEFDYHVDDDPDRVETLRLMVQKTGSATTNPT